MLSPAQFRLIVSGRQTGLKARLLRGLLALAEPPYAAVVGRRNRSYDLGRNVTRIDRPVVSVGNLTLGGTGKTPLVKWIARWLFDRGARPAILSRGYGARPGQVNDEALELQEDLPEVPHLPDPNRVAAAGRAMALGCGAIVLDDGFQHRRLGRDLDLVLLDALEPFGFGRIFPRGTLREPVEGLRRADGVLLSRADLIDESQRTAIRRRVAELAPGAFWAEVAHAPMGLLSSQGQTRPISWLSGVPVAGFCGLGNPAGFRHTLLQCGCEVRAFHEFPDHHRYTPADVGWLAAWGARSGAAAVVCSAKDLVKLREVHLGALALLAVKIEMRFLAGEQALRERLERLIAGWGTAIGR